jgi:hypothetical protein
MRLDEMRLQGTGRTLIGGEPVTILDFEFHSQSVT